METRTLLILCAVLALLAIVGRLIGYFFVDGNVPPTAGWAWALVIVLAMAVFALYRAIRYWVQRGR